MKPNAEQLNATDQIRRHDLAQAKAKLKIVRAFLKDFEDMDPADVEVSHWIEEALRKRDRLERKIKEAKAANNHGMVVQLTASLARLNSTRHLTLQDKAPKAFISERHEELHAQEQALLATIERLEEDIAAFDAAWEAAERQRLQAEADARLRSQFQAERQQREDAEFQAWKRARDQQSTVRAG